MPPHRRPARWPDEADGYIGSRGLRGERGGEFRYQLVVTDESRFGLFLMVQMCLFRGILV